MPDKKKKYPQWIYTVNIVLWSVLIIGLGGSLILEREEKNGFVSKEMYGDKWPLTVDSGTLSCVSAENFNDHLWAYETFFTTAEKKYTVYSREAQDGLFEGKKPKYPFMSDELTFDLDGNGRFDKPISFLEIKAKSLCEEFDKDGKSRYKLLPIWRRTQIQREGLGIPNYILK